MDTQDLMWTFWAAHPGVRILEAVEQSIGLTKDQLYDSWQVLEKYGNMLSPSILFVIEHHIQRRKNSNELNSGKQRELGIGFSWSPGVGIEGFLFELYY